MVMSQSACDAARKLLTGTKAQQLCADKRACVILRSTATVDQALKELAKNRILSAPVVLAAPEHGEATWPSDTPAAGTLGFLDIKDILYCFLNELNDKDLPERNLLYKMRLLEEQGCRFGAKQLAALHTLGSDGGFLDVSQAGCSLLELMQGMLDPEARRMQQGSRGLPAVVHRIALFEQPGRILSILSQSDIIRFLADHLEALGALQHQCLQELGMVQQQVQGVLPETSAILAVGMMQEKGVSSLAVVDANGKIIGNFSASEMRTITSEQFGALALPVGEFLALEHRVEYVGINRMREEGVVGSPGHRFVMDRVGRKGPHVPGEDVGQALILCRPQDKFGEVLAKLAQHRIHRVYVVDEEERPMGIITCTDILSKLVEACS